MKHAIVMGGSIAGMCAAAALARTFDRVTVLERDEDPGGPFARRGVPQSNQPHLLLSRGRKVLESLMPGLGEGLAKDGVVEHDMGSEVKWFQHGIWKISFRSDMPIWFHTRPLLEEHMRRRMRDKSNVELRFGVAVDRPIHVEGAVRGVRLRNGSELAADLVVDATGRGTRSPAWLAAWGYGEVVEEQVDIGLAYVSGEFESAPGKLPVPGVVVFQQPPTLKRGGYGFQVEDGRWQVTMIGYHGDHPPTDPDEFVGWSKTLAQPTLHDSLVGAKPTTPLRRYTFPHQLRRRFEAMKLPDGYVILGDATCSFDPTFGQGMSIAAMQAELLGKLVGRRSTQKIQARLAGMATIPWSMTSSEAHRWAETRGPEPFGASLLRRYAGRLFELAGKYRDVYRVLLDVMQFEASPMALLHPQMLRRVLFG
ncbi:NAD(P)/FAD-dependent oxidoreductase [Nannocystaceae bacterium ST9]